MLVDGDKYVLAGRTDVVDAQSNPMQVVAARLNNDGGPDATFNGNGRFIEGYSVTGPVVVASDQTVTIGFSSTFRGCTKRD